MRHVVLVTPPAVERAEAAWELMDGQTVIVCADHEQAVLWADAAPAELRAHAVTGLARTAALLKEGRVGVLAGSPADLGALVTRSALKLDTLKTLVIAWPESFSGELDTLLGEAPEARRVILSWDPHGLTDFIERHARRAEIVGDIPLDSVGKPLGPVASARYAIVPAARRGVAVRDVLDAVRSVRPYIWKGGDVAAPAAPAEPPDAVVATTLPTREEFRRLAAIAQPLLVALASQVPYLKSIASLSPFALPSRADRASDRNAALRAEISTRLMQTDVDAELAVLAPLFEEHDPALVAAALLAIRRQPTAVSEPVTQSQPEGWAKVFVSVGSKDRASAKDLVGALIKEAGLQKGQIGKIDVRETFSLVDISPAAVQQAVERLTGVSIRGRRVTARTDRG